MFIYFKIKILRNQEGKKDEIFEYTTTAKDLEIKKTIKNAFSFNVVGFVNEYKDKIIHLTYD